MSRLRSLSGRRGGAGALLVGFTLVPFFVLCREAAGQACPAPQSPPACTENARSTAGTDVVDQWKCWQKSLRSTGYSGVNAYRDLELTVEIRKTSNNSLVRAGWGFWDCTEGGTTEVFRIRTALPAGTYKWEAKCRNRTGTPASVRNCATDPNLNGPSLVAGGTASGTFNVTAKTVQNDRYDRGFLTLSTNRRFLKQGSTAVPFFWLGDTAWAASNLAARSGDWATYLDTRKKQGFTTVLLVAAPHFGGVTASQVFQQVPGCVSDGTKIPNNCSRWNPPYWQQLEAKIQDANAKGLLVMVTGLMEPFDYLDSANPYGSPAWLSLFARGLAARLAGHHAVLSPGMDDLFNSTTRPLADAVGNAISQAAPAHLVTHHGGGSSGCTDYTSLLQTTSWHDFHVFQSGHCLSLKRNVNPGQELPCDPRRNYPPFNSTPGTEDETAVACVTRRAQEMSSNLFSQAAVKPSVNGEAVYDKNPASQASAPAPGNRQYVRHTAYMSALSGSFGFTYGTDPVVYWSFTGANTLPAALGPVPTTTGTVPSLADHSAWDMQRMASIFKARPWKEFVPEPTRIKNQPTASESKMAYAHSTNYVYNLAYSPASNNVESIRLDLSPLSPAFICGGNFWKAAWIRPVTNDTIQIDSALCSGAGSAVTFTKPLTCRFCEWALSIIRTGAKIDESGDPVLNALQIWPELFEAGVAIRGQLRAPSGDKIGEPMTLSQSSEEVFRKHPLIARDGGGSFFVVWEAEDQDGSLFGIFGRRFDNLGRPLGDEVQINTQTDHDQAEPWVSTAPSGDAVVVWMSFDQDGDLGGIFGQRYDKLGRPEGTELQVNTVTQGHQGSPRVDMDAQGGFIVTWESEEQEGDGLGIFGQRFDSLGLPAGEEFEVTPSGSGDQVLADLRVHPGGSFEVSWYDYSLEGDLLSLSSRRFTAEGEPEE